MSSAPHRAAEAVVRGAVLVLAAWTLAYHAALAGGWGSSLALALAGALLLAYAAWSRGRVSSSLGAGPAPAAGSADAPGPPRPLVLAGVLAAALALTPLRWFAVLAAAALGAAPLLRGRAAVPGRAALAGSPVGAPAWLLAAGSALGASVLVRHDADDAYLVNLSTYVAERGVFPRRDTMFTDQVWPALSTHTPPVESFEALVGALARVLGVAAPDLTYLVLPPLLTLVSVLALGLLVGECRLRRPALALTAGVVFLWCSGAMPSTHGNFFALRLWHGKALLPSLLLPVVLLVGIRLLRGGDRRHWLLLWAATIAACGASNSMVFLAPLLLGALALAAVLRGAWRLALLLLAPVAYPVGVGLAMLLDPGRRAIPAGVEPGTTLPSVREMVALVAGHGGLLVSTCLALALGVWGVRSRTARLALAAVLAALVVALLPGWGDALARFGLLPVLWRAWWVVPLPLLVAAAADLVATSAQRWRPGVGTVLGTALALALAAAPLLGGRWLGDPGNRAYWATPATWKVPPGARERAELALRLARPGEHILAPWDTSRVLATTTSRVLAVNPRTFYLMEYVDVPGAQTALRQALDDYLEARPGAPADVDAALSAVRVDLVCAQRPEVLADLGSKGWRVVGTAEGLSCLRRG